MTILARTVISVMTAFGLTASLTATPSVAAEALATLTQANPMLALNPAILSAEADPVVVDSADTDAAPQQPATLAALVESQETDETVDAEQDCLATSVYFESKGEPLAGQLAVAETVLNRAGSGRFANSICGVVRQPGQFSFVRAGRLPEPVRSSRAWRQAVAVARIAQADLWADVAPDALFFHASSVRPSFGGKRIARLGNHIFYR